MTLVAVLCLSGFGFAARAARGPLWLDSAVDGSLGRTSGPGYRLALLLSEVGHPRIFVMITAMVVLALLLGGDHRGALTAVVTVPVTLVLVERVLKPFFDRHLGSLPGATFPSGHTAVAAALGGAVILAAGAGRPLGGRLGPAGRYGLVATVLLVCCAIGLAMVVLQAHYLTDVLAGLPLGLSVSGSVALFLDTCATWWHRRRRGAAMGPTLEPAPGVASVGSGTS